MAQEIIDVKLDEEFAKLSAAVLRMKREHEHMVGFLRRLDRHQGFRYPVDAEIAKKLLSEIGAGD